MVFARVVVVRPTVVVVCFPEDRSGRRGRECPLPARLVVVVVAFSGVGFLVVGGGLLVVGGALVADECAFPVVVVRGAGGRRRAVVVVWRTVVRVGGAATERAVVCGALGAVGGVVVVVGAVVVVRWAPEGTFLDLGKPELDLPRDFARCLAARFGLVCLCAACRCLCAGRFAVVVVAAIVVGENVITVVPSATASAAMALERVVTAPELFMSPLETSAKNACSRSLN
ncbi:MAG TPA: hypothetical protein VME20_10300 [Acidimicrobiales bacterium]|nr:hypothetical protein [Acidimicrobiales bacterium]